MGHAVTQLTHMHQARAHVLGHLGHLFLVGPNDLMAFWRGYGRGGLWVI